jgi:glucose-1-phosphate cytidylyltransferase
LTDDRGLKVVLFCGGRGLRLGEHRDPVPKPMVPIGYRPVLWHVMRYYAHFGHRRFVLCLGHRADAIKEYFLRYSEALSNDFVLRRGGSEVELLSSDIEDWEVAFVDTGLDATIAERLLAVREHVEGEGMFLANYGDGLTDAPLDEFLDDFSAQGKTGGFVTVRAPYSYDFVTLGEGRVVDNIAGAAQSDIWINGGYFMFRDEIFDQIQPGEELVREPFRRLIAEQELLAYRYEGFWAPMDTLKDHQSLEELFHSGRPPWALWQLGPRPRPRASTAAR